MLDPDPSAAEKPAAAALPQFSSNNDVRTTVACLMHWCPNNARAFAMAMHELAAWHYDDHRIEHWLAVLGRLLKD